MTFLNSAKRTFFVLFVMGLTTVALASRAEAQQLSIQAVEVSIAAAQDGAAPATFRISVTSSEESALMSFTVAYKDGTSVELGDVPAQGSLVSDSQTKLIDVSNPSMNIPIPVTVTYTINGTQVEIPWNVVLKRP